MIKKFCFGLLIILLVFGILAQFGCASENAKVYNWNYNTSYDSTYFVGGSFIQHWANMVWRETNHQLKINVFYSGTLGYKGGEMLSTISNGLIESAEFSAVMGASEAKQPWWKFDDFYALYDNWDQLMYVFNVAAPIVREDIDNFGGVKLLALFPCTPEDTFEGIWMNKKIEKWDDFKGTKVRTYFGVARKYCLDPLGFSSLFLPGAETYQGIKTGLVDGAIQAALTGYTGKYAEIAKYFYVFEPICANWWGIMCGEKAFNALPKDVQDGLVRASKSIEDLIIDHLWPYSSDFAPGLAGVMSTKDVLEYLKDKGNVVVRVPLLQKKIQEQNEIGMLQWIADEGGPRGQLLYDALLKARELYPGSYPELFDSLPILEIEE
jgi:TRAP-type C4-dicarboxylate transport system substrate-binding protein